MEVVTASCHMETPDGPFVMLLVLRAGKTERRFSRKISDMSEDKNHVEVFVQKFIVDCYKSITLDGPIPEQNKFVNMVVAKMFG